ncbi:MAG: hypothetical protein LKI24_11260 [Acidipropionibacterium sp.]|nr:hypothetical protein [Acidipropionibacterium sp.]
MGIGVGLWLLQRVAVVASRLASGGRLPDDLMGWDAQWYARIAGGGYHWPDPLPGPHRSVGQRPGLLPRSARNRTNDGALRGGRRLGNP